MRGDGCEGGWVRGGTGRMVYNGATLQISRSCGVLSVRAQSRIGNIMSFVPSNQETNSTPFMCSINQ